MKYLLILLILITGCLTNRPITEREHENFEKEFERHQEEDYRQENR